LTWGKRRGEEAPLKKGEKKTPRAGAQTKKNSHGRGRDLIWSGNGGVGSLNGLD